MTAFINFFDGYTSPSTPIVNIATRLKNYANDAAFEADNLGTPIAGNIYHNTTDSRIRYYKGAEWDFVPDGATFDILAAQVATNVIDINDIITSKGAASGIATLDGNSKVPIAQLPDAVLGTLQYQGTWDASTNTPTLGDSGVGGSTGHFYVVSVAGSTSLDGESDWNIGDWVVHNQTIWEKVDNSDKVSSVNGQNGVVVLTKSDVGLSNVTDDTQLKRDAGDLNTFTEKTNPVNDDIVIIEDSEDSFNKKKVKLENMLGGGAGGINYTLNPDFEQNSNNHVAYKDSAQEVPEDGIGGSPTLTISRNTALPLDGIASGVILKPASDTQGEGVRIENRDFAIADRGTIQIISFKFDASDPNYDDGNLRVYFKDETNGTIIRVNGEDIKGGKNTHYARVQIPIDCINGSVLIHCATTDVDAFIFKYDRISFGPQVIQQGAIVTDWEDFTPTGTWVSGNETYTGRFRRVGSELEIQYRIGLTGAPTNTSLFLDLPQGLSVDENQLLVTDSSAQIGIGEYLNTGVSRYALYGGYNSSLNQLVVRSLESTTTDARVDVVTGVSPFSGNTGDSLVFNASLPIQGWSSQANMSSDFGGRIIAVEGAGNSGSVITANITDIDFVITRDTSDSFDGSSFLSPENGDYNFSGGIAFTAFVSGVVLVYVDGILRKRVSHVFSSENYGNFNGSVYLNRGESLSFRFDTSATLVNLPERHTLSIIKLASPQTNLEVETIAARYTTDSGQSIPVANVYSTVVFEDKDYDDSGSYNSTTGVYTSPYVGRVEITANVTRAAGVSTTYEVLAIFKNGIVQTETLIRHPSNINPYALSVTDTLDMNVGDTIEIKMYSSAGVGTSTLGIQNTLTIKKVK